MDYDNNVEYLWKFKKRTMNLCKKINLKRNQLDLSDRNDLKTETDLQLVGVLLELLPVFHLDLWKCSLLIWIN